MPRISFRLLNFLACVLTLAGLCAASGSGLAQETQPPLVLSGDAPSFRLQGHLAIAHDPHGESTIEDMASRQTFQPRPPEASERNYTKGAIWYRFTALREAGMPAEWVLAIGEPFIEDIRVYVPDPAGGFRETQLGRRIPSADLPIAARLHVVQLTLPEAVPTTIHIRLASHDEIQFDATLWRPHALMFVEVRASTLLGMFFTALGFIVLTYLLFGISLRDPPMIAYAIYVATFILFAGSHSGIMAVLFPTSSGPLTNMLTGVGVLGNIAAIIFMWDRVLDLRATYPAFHRAYVVAGTMTLISFVAIPSPWYIYIVPPTFVATMLVTVVSLGLAIGLVRGGRGNYLINYYIAAFIPFLLFSLLHAAEAFFPSSIEIMLVRLVGTMAMLAHIVILSIALARRVAVVHRERIRADTELAATRAAIRDHRNFVSMLSHQIRNPLAIITAAVDVMEIKHRLTTDAAKIRRAALRIRDLTSDLLADSRLEEISAPIAKRPVDLAVMLERLCEELGESARQRIRLGIDAEPAVVMGDPTLLGVLFSNFLDNSLKYSSPDGEILVNLGRQGDSAIVRVADTGTGIPPAEVDKVFEKYYRCSVTSSQPGTGLGLYLVRQIAERHGGSVSLRTAPGQGTEFTVRLPAALGQKPLDEREPALARA